MEVKAHFKRRDGWMRDEILPEYTEEYHMAVMPEFSWKAAETPGVPDFTTMRRISFRPVSARTDRRGNIIEVWYEEF